MPAALTVQPLEPRVGCIASAMEIIGSKWTALILRDLAAGPKRFSELQKSLGRQTGATADTMPDGSPCANPARSLSPRTLSQRLDDLESRGVISRQTFAEMPPRSLYRLTAKGEDLLPILRQMAVWGEKYYSGS